MLWLPCRLKGFVGNAIDHATSVPAWLASKAVPVAADGAGLFKYAAADAADRVALFRRGCVRLPDLATHLLHRTVQGACCSPSGHAALPDEQRCSSLSGVALAILCNIHLPAATF